MSLRLRSWPDLLVVFKVVQALLVALLKTSGRVDHALDREEEDRMVLAGMEEYIVSKYAMLSVGKLDGLIATKASRSNLRPDVKSITTTHASSLRYWFHRNNNSRFSRCRCSSAASYFSLVRVNLNTAETQSTQKPLTTRTELSHDLILQIVFELLVASRWFCLGVAGICRGYE
jgi:hypothetical protein